MFLSPSNKNTTFSHDAPPSVAPPEKHVFPDCCYCGKPCAKRWIVVAFLFGVALIVVAATLPGFINNQITDGIQDQLILDGPDATGFSGWQTSFDPAGDKEKFSIYMWNVVNPLEVLDGRKPHLEEMGPYCYNENKVRFDVSFLNDTFVQYKEWLYYTWDQECSNGHEDDLITTLNIPFQAIKAQIWPEHPDILEALYILTSDENVLFSKRTVKEILWGYRDPILYLATQSDFPGLQTNFTTQDNASAAYGYTLMDSGQQNIANVQKLYTYQGSNILQGCLVGSCPYGSGLSVPMWYNDAASQVPFVTEGTQFSPFLNPGDPLAAFVDDTNSVFNLTNVDNKWETIKGIDMLLYLVNRSCFENATIFPPNAAHDMFGPFGFLNVTRVEHSMPAFLTNPHFYNTGYDPALYFEGDILEQDPSKHQTFVWVEPNLGKTLKASKRLQVSFEIGPVWMDNTKAPHLKRGNPWFPKLQPVFFPVAWFEEAGTISDSQADDFKNSIYFAQNLARSIKWVCSVFGAIIIGLVCIWWWRNVCRSPPEMVHTQSLLSPGNTGSNHNSRSRVRDGGDGDDVEEAGSRYVRGGNNNMKQPASEAEYKSFPHDDDVDENQNDQ